MVIRQHPAEDKQERADAILDAAERLLLRSPERVANVAEVADEAGLAKGTVYLYFPSKEELLLAVHERRIDGFFRALIALVERDAPARFDDLLTLTRRHLIEPPLFLPLASRCFGLMASASRWKPPSHSAADAARPRRWRASSGICELDPGGGVALLVAAMRHRRPVAMSADVGDGRPCTSSGRTPPALVWQHFDETSRAACAWRGTVAARPDVATEHLDERTAAITDDRGVRRLSDRNGGCAKHDPVPKSSGPSPMWRRLCRGRVFAGEEAA
jgi:AcrR family transcriptional regulator